MSHELRTPMNAIIGFSEILQDRRVGGLNEKQAKYTDNILFSARHLLGLINDVLDLSKIEAGRMQLDLGRFDIAKAIRSAEGTVRPLAEKKGLSVTVRLNHGMPPVLGDGVRLQQVLYNLLSNAIKFTPDGGKIAVRAQQEDGCVRVSVTDTGIGLAAADIDRIFKEFEQVDSSYSRKQQGTGLGLPLSRRLVEMHGGSLWVESAGHGLGSMFAFTVPLAAEVRRETAIAA
jgi:signal transduction histidine kinase